MCGFLIPHHLVVCRTGFVVKVKRWLAEQNKETSLKTNANSTNGGSKAQGLNKWSLVTSTTLNLRYDSWRFVLIEGGYSNRMVTRLSLSPIWVSLMVVPTCFTICNNSNMGGMKRSMGSLIVI